MIAEKKNYIKGKLKEIFPSIALGAHTPKARKSV
jgi:hypothetical protein